MLDRKERSALGDLFDRTIRALDGLPDRGSRRDFALRD
jgi:hypothetical protein